MQKPDLRKHVVDNVILNNAVEDVASNEAKFTVDGRQSALDESPVISVVMSSILVCVVQVCNSNCGIISIYISLFRRGPSNLPIQWFIQRYGSPYIRNVFMTPRDFET
jgi:hypothetical protein